MTFSGQTYHLFSVLILPIFGALLLGTAGCTSTIENPDQQTDTVASSEHITVKVALFQWVPRYDQFEELMIEMWDELYDNVDLEVVKWDCYSDEYDPTIDVFVFDGIFLSNYVENGYLKSLGSEYVTRQNDYLPFAWEAIKDSVNGSVEYFGFPQIGCTNMIFHRKGDTELEAARTLSEIHAVIGDAAYTSAIPQDNEGLLIDLSGGTTSACLYVEAAMDYNIPYSWNPPLPNYYELDEIVVKNLRTLMYMGGAEQVTYEDTVNWNSYLRGEWFDQGSGRAFCGFTENMSHMATNLENVEFKIMPYSDDEGYNLFYTDIVGINSAVDKDKYTHAYNLAMLLSSADYIAAAFGPYEEHSSPQYLMPVSYSAYEALDGWPMYKMMKDIVVAADGQAFKLGPDSKDWLATNKDSIQDIITREIDKMIKEREASE
jgi:thiamine pyridinylase